MRTARPATRLRSSSLLPAPVVPPISAWGPSRCRSISIVPSVARADRGHGRRVVPGASPRLADRRRAGGASADQGEQIDRSRSGRRTAVGLGIAQPRQCGGGGASAIDRHRGRSQRQGQLVVRRSLEPPRRRVRAGEHRGAEAGQRLLLGGEHDQRRTRRGLHRPSQRRGPRGQRARSVHDEQPVTLRRREHGAAGLLGVEQRRVVRQPAHPLPLVRLGGDDDEIPIGRPAGRGELHDERAGDSGGACSGDAERAPDSTAPR